VLPTHAKGNGAGFHHLTTEETVAAFSSGYRESTPGDGENSHDPTRCRGSDSAEAVYLLQLVEPNA
ncbi:hypothetical protein, partial [Stenotrophomonas maltophilia]|uniref:hypothetical protein n=1 Tax=Stenotrophomonas maltophilia TaxID=40324 RepID=UPI003BF86763